MVLCVLGSVWLRDRLELGAWVIVLGVLLGVGGSFAALWQNLKELDRQAKEDDDDPGVGFNDHK